MRFFVTLSPVSLLLYFFYRWLYKKASALRRNKQTEKKIQSKLMKQSCQQDNPIKPERLPLYEDDLQQFASHFINTKTTGNSPMHSKQSPAHEACRLIWHQTDLYIKFVDHSLTRKQHMYLWSAYFYAVVKSVNNQQFINDVYSHFDTFAIRYVKDPGNRSFVVNAMRRDYREFRPVLNASKINPCNEEGRKALWDLVCSRMYVYGNCPPNARSQFLSSVSVLVTHSQKIYSNISFSDSLIRYSLDSCDSAEAPP